MKAIKVKLDGTKPFDALVYENDTWNGWLCPYLPFREMQRFADEVTNDYVKLTFKDGRLIVFDVQEDEIQDTILPMKHEGELYYNLGSLGWCFEEHEEQWVDSISYIEDGHIVVAVRSNYPFKGALLEDDNFYLYTKYKIL